jgi:hypothetical protein
MGTKEGFHASEARRKRKAKEGKQADTVIAMKRNHAGREGRERCHNSFAIKSNTVVNLVIKRFINQSLPTNILLWLKVVQQTCTHYTRICSISREILSLFWRCDIVQYLAVYFSHFLFLFFYAFCSISVIFSSSFFPAFSL